MDAALYLLPNLPEMPRAAHVSFESCFKIEAAHL